ncbi:DUF547 domain-containing protein [Kaarinaea lacus]
MVSQKIINIICITVLLLVTMTVAMAQTVVNDDFDHNHQQWDDILRAYVVEQGPASKVKYAQLKANGLSQLEQYLKVLSAVTQAQFASWSEQQQLAFLINAYNAFTVKLILNHYPVDSIKDIGGWFQNPWKIEFFSLLGKKTYLDYIEHSLIRGNSKYSEPRIHFALVCASVGCPKLQPRAFTAKSLQSMLEQGAKEFTQDSSRNRYDAGSNELQLSSIFKWYGEDFEPKYGSVAQFVSPYLNVSQDVRDNIKTGKINLEFLEYDWSLNDAR